MEAQPTTEKKKRGAPKGRVITEAQREGLKKGFEALKAKREALKKGKELSNPEPITNELPNNNLPTANKPLDIQPPKVNAEVSKKTRNRVPTASKDDINSMLQNTRKDISNELNSFKTDILNVLSPKQTTILEAKPVATVAPTAPVIEPPKPLTGSDLLNKIFFNR